MMKDFSSLLFLFAILFSCSSPLHGSQICDNGEVRLLILAVLHYYAPSLSLSLHQLLNFSGNLVQNRTRHFW